MQRGLLSGFWLGGLLAVTGGCSSSDSSTSGSGAPNTSTGAAAGEVADEFVRAHNAVRAAVMEPEDYPGEWEPIPPVIWSETVAATAQAWAETLRDREDCDLVHDDQSGYGENLAAGSSGLTATEAVTMWASEGANYAYSPSYRFEMDTGHFTQLVWRNTERIGCGSATCDNGWTVVCCRYDPPGNYLGAQPY